MGTTGQSITLANSIIGVGILAMPFCFQQCGVLLATAILLFMGLISRLCCYFLLKSAILARRRNFEFLALHVFGSAGKMAVEVGIIGFLMGTCIAYFVVVGDLGPQIISKMFNINQSSILRTSIMVIVSLVCVLPLGLLRNVDSLSNVSAATICFYLCLVIKVITEAATQLPSGAWQERVELWRPQGLLQCVPIFSMALFCQTQLFEIFESLPSLSLEKMNLVTKNAINICTGVYFTLGVFGYIAFSEKEISGNVLMSLSPTLASDVIKLGFVMSLAFSFPLIIFPCRASLYSFLYNKVHSSHHDHIINHSIPESTFRAITCSIVAVSLLVSVLLPSIELVLGLLGATIGVLVCLVFPAAVFLNLTMKNTSERLLAKGVVVLGLFIMVLGTYANLQAAESQIERYDERYITQEKIDKIVEDFFEKRGEDGINLNPIPENPVEIDPNKLNGKIIKDSEIQPPNPVPPESNSFELKRPLANAQKLNLNNIKNEKSLDDVLLPEKLKEEAADTISDTHPKNVKSKLNGAKTLNGNFNNVNNLKEKPKQPPSNDENKVDKIKLMKQQQLIETMKQHGKEQKELMQEQKEIFDEIIKTKKEINVEKPIEPEIKSDEAKIDSNKHQQLIETIKQHGEEQKELMKEQKEILDEIKELKQNKDTDSLEAKKLAVESIKQIADMAIKSIGGVTEKPDGQQEEVKKVESLEKLTNEAVQEIAKKAVETIEAIQEIKEKPEAVKPAASDTNNNKVQNIIPQAKPLASKVVSQNIVIHSERNLNQNEDKHLQANVKRELLSNNAPSNEIKQPLEDEKSNIAAPVQSNKAIDNELKQNIEKENAPVPEVIEEKLNEIKPNPVDINTIIEKKQNEIEPKPVDLKTIIEKKHNEIERKHVNINTNTIDKQSEKDIEVKPHSHSPDEPQSYKLGEESQVKIPEKENVPLAVVMSDQAKLENNVQTKAKLIKSQIVHNIDNGVKENIGNNKMQVPKVETVVRQKREIVDCTQKVSEPAYLNLCKALNLVPIENSMEILPKVDLNNHLSKIPLHFNIGRSLKNFDEKRKR